MEKYNLEQTGQQVQNILNESTPQSDLAEEVERAQEAEHALGEGIQQNADDIDAIEGKIPSAATSENKLTDKEYVDGLVDDEKNRAQDAEQQNADDIDALEAIIPSNASSENKLATSNDVDEVAQSVGTEETRAKAAEKQNADDIDAIEAIIPLDATSENKLATVSDITTEATTRENADAALQSAIEAILLLIPSAASSLNQLADKAFVNSSIATNTATFRGTFNLVNDLHLTLAATHAQVGNALALAILESDNNDYAFVQVPTAETAPNEIAQTDRYKFNGTSWEYEYTLNNSGFTSAQWVAINSGITSSLVTKLSDLPTNAQLTTELGTLTSGITAINQKIPAAAAQNNKLVDTAALESYIVQVLGVLTVSYNITSTDGHVTLAIQQTDGKITSVSLTTSDIASAAALNLKASQADLTALANRVTTAESNITSLSGRVSTNETDIAQLQAAYSGLTQSDIIIGALPASGVANKIYRVPGTNSYSDYMWNGTQFVLMATYNNAIDPRPRKASQNLVTSGGVFDNMGALDISELNATENPHTLATYADLSAALAAIPSNDYKKGGMSVKFVQTDDNKYVQWRLMATSWSTNVGDWQGVEKEPLAGSHNISESNGIVKYVDTFNSFITQKNNNDGNNDLQFADPLGKVVLSIINGYIKTKNFDGSALVNLVNTLNEDTIKTYFVNNSKDFELSDIAGNVLLELKNGGIKTKNFDSSLISTIDWNNKNWFAYGTSLTAKQSQYPLRGVYADYVAEHFGMNLTNRGSGGSGMTTASDQEIYNRIMTLDDGKADADLITLECGANDQNGVIGNISDHSNNSTICGALNLILEYLQVNTHARIVVMSSWPFRYRNNVAKYPWDTYGSDNHTWYDMAKAIEKVCNQNGVQYIPLMEECGMGQQARMNADINNKFMVDQIHPTDLGAYNVAQYLIQKIKDIPLWKNNIV